MAPALSPDTGTTSASPEPRPEESPLAIALLAGLLLLLVATWAVATGLTLAGQL